jgi:hypothetical protein
VKLTKENGAIPAVPGLQWKIVSQGVNRRDAAYNGVVFEVKKEIPARISAQEA